MDFPDINTFNQLEGRHRSTEEFKDVYPEIFKKYKNPTYLEVGCWAGWSLTIALLSGCAKATVVEIDPKCIDVTKSNLERLGLDLSKVIFIQGNSFDVLPTLKPDYDVILLDGDYHYESARTDLFNALNLVRPNTTLVCHDATGDDFDLTNPMTGKNNVFQQYIGGGYAYVKRDYAILHKCFGIVTNITRMIEAPFGSMDLPFAYVTTAELERLYKASITGIYPEELLDDIVAKFIQSLETLISKGRHPPESQLNQITELIKLLKNAKTDQEKMLAVDRVINTAHKTGLYGWYIINVKTDKEAQEFFDKLRDLKP